MSKKTNKVQSMQELGGTGTVLVQGLLTLNDYNPDLTGTRRIEKFDEMRLGDATVRAVLLSVKLPILSANWYMKPASEDAKDVEISEWVASQLFENDNFSWTKFLREVLTFCEYGCSVFEKVYSKLPDGRIGWSKFGPRLQKTIYKWSMNNGVDEGITQMLPITVNGDSIREIPKWKLMYFINEMEGENYEGISLLRAAYKHWYIKEAYYKIDAMAAERQGLGLPRIKKPNVASPADIAKARELAKNIRANHEAYLDLPPNFDIEFVDMKANTVKDVKDMVHHHDRQISKAVLVQFLELGAQSSSGSYSLSETHADLFYLGLQALAKLIQEEMQRHVREVVDLNYITDHYPTIEYGKIGKIDFEKLSTALERLANKGIIVPDKELERYVREAMDLPEKLAEEEVEEKHTKDKKENPEQNLDDLKKKDVEASEVLQSIRELAEDVEEAINAKEKSKS